MAVVGSAEVVVRATTTGFKKSLADAFREARGIAETEGERYGKAFGNKFKTHFKANFREGFRELRDWTKAEGGRQGKLYANAFGSELKKSMRASLKEAFADVEGRIVTQASSIGEDFSQGIRDGMLANGPIDFGDMIDGDSVVRAIDDVGDRAGAAAKRTGRSIENSLDFAGMGSRGGNAFSRALTPKFRSAALSASRSFTVLYGVGNIITTVIAQVVGGLSALISAFFALTSAASTAAGSLAVLPSLLSALGQAAITAAFAFSGIGKAISAGFELGRDSTEGATKAAVNAAEQVADARKALARLQEDNARRIRDANYRVSDAEEDLAESQEEARAAQNALTFARELAIERLQQLAFDVEGAALSEERAVLRLQRATQNLAEVQANPASTAQELQEASLNYREAELAVRQAQDALEDIEELQEEAAEAGVEGSAEVVEAQNDIIDANNAVLESQEALRRAQEDLRDTEIDNARALADAQERLRRAIADQTDALGAASGAASKFNQAMERLSPEAQAFVQYIITLRDEIDALKAAAGRRFFPVLTAEVQRIVEDFFPAFEQALEITGEALGSFATSIADVLTEAGFIARFSQIAEDNTTTIERFGEVFASVLNGISGVLIAVAPLTERFTRFISDQAQAFEEYATSGAGMAEMAIYFERAGDVAGQLARIIDQVWGGIRRLGEAAAPAGQMLLDQLEDVSGAFEDLNGGAVRQNQLENFFFDASKAGSEVMGLLWDIGKAFLRMGADPAIAQSAQTLREQWIPVLEDLLGKVLGASGAFSKFVVAVTEVLNAFADTGSIETFFDTLTLVADIIRVIVDSPLGRFFLGVLGPLVAFGKALALSSMVLGFFGKAIAGSYIKLIEFRGGIPKVISALGNLRLAFQITNAHMLQSAAANSTATKAAAATASLLGGKINTSGIVAGLGAVRIGLAGLAAGAAVAGRAMLAMMGGPVGVFIIGLVAAVAVFSHFSRKAKDAQRQIDEFADTLDEATGALTVESYEEFADELDSGLVESFEKLGFTVGDLMVAFSQGEEGMANLEAELTALGLSTAQVENFMEEAREGQEKWDETNQKAREQWEKNNGTMKLAGEEVNTYTEAAKKATVVIEDNAYAAELAEDYVTELSDAYKDAVDSFTLLNDTAITQERTNIRVQESMDDLTTSFREHGYVLDETTESGRSNKEAILDSIEAIDRQAQAMIDAGVPLEEVQAKYEANIQALIESTGVTGAARTSVENYIASVQKTPEEKVTQFTAIIQAEALAAVVQSLDATTAARFAVIAAEQDVESFEDVGRALAALIAEDWEVPMPPEVVQQAYDQTRNDLNALLYNEDGSLREPEFIPKEDKEEIERLRGILDDIAKKRTAEVDIDGNLNLNVDSVSYDLPQNTRDSLVDRIKRGNYAGSRAEGGPIIGPGGPTADKAGLFALSNGEFVLSAKSVRALGGMGRVTALHNSLKRHRPPHLAGGGVVSPAAGGTLTLLAEAGSSERVTPLGSDGLSAGDRAILDELRQLREQSTGSVSVSIGSIENPRPTQVAREIVAEMRAESYRMGQYR